MGSRLQPVYGFDVMAHAQATLPAYCCAPFTISVNSSPTVRTASSMTGVRCSFSSLRTYRKAKRRRYSFSDEKEILNSSITGCAATTMSSIVSLQPLNCVSAEKSSRRSVIKNSSWITWSFRTCYKRFIWNESKKHFG